MWYTQPSKTLHILLYLSTIILSDHTHQDTLTFALISQGASTVPLKHQILKNSNLNSKFQQSDVHLTGSRVQVGNIASTELAGGDLIIIDL